MSTFNGVVKEFPDIRIDHFRISPRDPRPPLAYFLSHVHSDHLEGLESCKSPFIYCSPATKEILLRLEKYPHRMNFQRGIIESRKQTYKHVRKLLKTIPLETPIEIELAPERTIRVTLFDANHCVGAVMFFIEDDTNSILYTGDVRSEAWWVNGLTRHPFLLPYVHHAGKKPIKQLDCIYLDTTFANKSNPYKHFPSKAEGVTELLQKISMYPDETVFYFNSWTFGYEDVWLALSGFLNCRVHVDQYRYKLYAALEHGTDPKSDEGSWLSGFYCGNHRHQGCLTNHTSSRLHSCERGTRCEVFGKEFVRITPIISRHDGVEMAELGAGGGKGDLDQQHELEVYDSNILGQLLSFCETRLRHQPALLAKVNRMIGSLLNQPVHSVPIDASLLYALASAQDAEETADLNQMPLEEFMPILVKIATSKQETSPADSVMIQSSGQEPQQHYDHLSKHITFPYSRHSSYSELCHLIEVFKPTDIHPCTVDKAGWAPDQSMSFLFGHLYQKPCDFKHDQQMLRRMGKLLPSTVPDSRPGSFAAVGLAEKSRQPATRQQSEASTTTASCNDQKQEQNKHILAKHQLQTETSASSSAAMESSPTPQSGVAKTPHRPDYNLKIATLHAEPHVQGGPDSQIRREMASKPDGASRPIKQRRLDSDDEVESEVMPCAARPLMSLKSLSDAQRREVHDAIFEDDGAGWSRIGLVSVSGHQEKEIEL